MTTMVFKVLKNFAVCFTDLIKNTIFEPNLLRLHMEFQQFIGFLIFLTVFTMGFWLLIFLLTFVVPYWLAGAFKEGRKLRKEAKKLKE